MAGREGRRKPVARRSSFSSVAALMLIPVAGFAIFLAWRFIDLQLKRLRTPRATRHEEARAVPKAPVPSPKPAAVAPEPRVRGSIALILDDVGFDNQPLESAMEIDRNLSFSILPNAQNARAFATVLHRNGFEIMCHLPMEPVDYPIHSPGANAVMTSMTDDEVSRTTREDIAAVPYAAGVNNHMGSRATADERVMRTVLGSLPHGMFFIDSMTTRDSVGERLAREMRVPTGQRRVFLDDVQSEAEVRKQLRRLIGAAEQHGTAIGIGHMYPVTVKVLREDVPELRAQGFRFVRASEAVR